MSHSLILFDEPEAAGDKRLGRQPHWHFESVAEVPADYIDEHFRAPRDGDHPPRDLPEVKP